MTFDLKDTAFREEPELELRYSSYHPAPNSPFSGLDLCLQKHPLPKALGSVPKERFAAPHESTCTLSPTLNVPSSRKCRSKSRLAFTGPRPPYIPFSAHSATQHTVWECGSFCFGSELLVLWGQDHGPII